jgi:hypothetical protein
MKKAVFVLLLLATLVSSPLSAAGGGGSYPGCLRCVIGNDNLPYCKDPSVYDERFRPVAPCEPVLRCFHFPDADYCYPDCDGNACYEV